MSGFLGSFFFPSRVSRTQKQEAIVSHQQIGGCLSAQIDPTNTHIDIYLFNHYMYVPKIRILRKKRVWIEKYGSMSYPYTSIILEI